MITIYELITLDVQNEHDLEHELEQKSKFSTPKIFDADGDLSKRWYVYYSYRNPETGKMQRMKNIYGKANRFKTKADRYTVLNLYKKRLLKFLKEGYNPLGDNTELFQEKIKKKTKTQQKEGKSKINVPEISPIKTKNKAQSKSMTIESAFKKAIELKTNVIGEKTLEDYVGRLKKLETWLKTNHKDLKIIDQVDKKIINNFLNEIQLNGTPRTRNNYRTIFSSIFQLLEDNEIIQNNFIKSIKPLKTKPKRHKTYSKKQQEAIFNYLDAHDPLLLLYIKFISYNFLRPIEVCRLRIKDLNIEEKTLQVKAKNKVLKTKIIPDILLKELPDLSFMNAEYFLFTPNGIGLEWNATLLNRRDNFSKRFKAVKEHFALGKNYTMYSFRHTFITKVYRALVKDSSPFEAKSKLMQITGHSTMTALEKYLRDIDAELPEDYSNLLT